MDFLILFAKGERRVGRVLEVRVRDDRREDKGIDVHELRERLCWLLIASYST